MKTYHTGFYFKGNTVIFQFKPTVDELSCELIEYTGERETTKTAAKERLDKVRGQIVADFRARYPHRNITSVRMEA